MLAEQAWREWKRQRGELAWFKRPYRQRQGWTVGFGPYELVSVDQGQHWYESHQGKLEPARAGLLEQLEGFEQLGRAAQLRHEPLLGDPAWLDEDQRMLEHAGFQVERKDR